MFSRSGFRRVSMEYDLLGRRIRKTGRDRETSFLWSGMRLARESSGTCSSSYVYEQGSYVPLARIDADGGKEMRMYYFHCAANGMPEEVTDREGRLVWRARYSIPGKSLFEQTTKHAPKDFEQNLRMQGQCDDRECGLYYNTFRYYDADSGRFTTQDPIGLLGGMNLYQYAPNPLRWIDPWGWIREHKVGQYHGPKPKYGNPGHHQPGPRYRGGGSKTTPLPADAEQVYKKAIPTANGETWYGQTEKGKVYRYQGKNGEVHWNARENSPRGLTVPPKIKARFKAINEKLGQCLSKK